jgi:outer membrane immunogenic protein
MPRSRQVLFCSAVLAASAVGPAVAADLPPSAYPPQAPAAYVPAPPPFSWTGFYIGGNAGYGWSSGSGTFTSATGSGPFSASGNGFLGGGQAGFNWQTGPFVWGMEADFQGATGSSSIGATAGATTVTATAKTPWFSTFRGRVGYAFDRLIVYGTGGGVYGNSTLNGTSLNAISGATAFSNSATFVSWTAGGGVEWAFWGPLSAKLEYLYIGSPSATPSIPGVTGVTGSASASIIRGGLNYHF